MKCVNCGKDIPDDSENCPFCHETVRGPGDKDNIPADARTDELNKILEKKKKQAGAKKKFCLVICIFAAVVFIAGAARVIVYRVKENEARSAAPSAVTTAAPPVSATDASVDLRSGAGDNPAADAGSASGSTDSAASSSGILYNNGGLVISVSGYQDSTGSGRELTLLVNNGSADNIEILAYDFTADGFAIENVTGATCRAFAGGSENLHIVLTDDMLAYTGLTAVGNITFHFNVTKTDESFNSSQAVSVGNKASVTVGVSAGGVTIPEGQQAVATVKSGVPSLVYDNAGLRIMYLGTKTEGADVINTFYVENDTQNDLSFNSDNETVNGKTVNIFTGGTVFASGKGKLTDSVYFCDCTSAGITQIDTLKSDVTIYNAGTMDKISSFTLTVDMGNMAVPEE